MVLLFAVAFLGGVVTVLSPCALPLLPILLSGTTSGGWARPWGIVVGFVGGFTAFTLGVTFLVQAFGFPVEVLRWVAGGLVLGFGLVTVVPSLQRRYQSLVSGWVSKPTSAGWKPPKQSGFGGGVALGLSLGLAWSPCVGPIMATVLTLALSQSVSGTAVALTVTYALGTALPLLGVMVGGRTLLAKVPWLSRHTETIQRVFGVLMMVTGLALLAGWDRDFQSFLLQAFPGYASGLTALEHQSSVLNELDQFQKP